MNMMLAIPRHVDACVLSRVWVRPPLLALPFFLLRLRQAIAEMPVPSRHQQSACKLYSETEKSSGTVAQAQIA
jgi:hypothetical protein